MDSEEIKGKFINDRSDKSHRIIKGVSYHCFRVETDVGIKGTIHVPANIKAIPGLLILEYAEND